MAFTPKKKAAGSAKPLPRTPSSNDLTKQSSQTSLANASGITASVRAPITNPGSTSNSPKKGFRDVSPKRYNSSGKKPMKAKESSFSAVTYRKDSSDQMVTKKKSEFYTENSLSGLSDENTRNAISETR